MWPDGAPLKFLRQFDTRAGFGGRTGDGDGDGEIAHWFRLRDPEAVPPAVRLLALADAPPPAVMPMFSDHVPISSVTWQVDVLDPHAPGEGWHLLRATAETAASGYTAQTMGMWDERGHAVVAGRQVIALFG